VSERRRDGVGANTAPSADEKASDAAAPTLPPIDPRLSVWLSPGFPVGAFAYSHGLELAADRRWIAGRDGVELWLRDLLERGSLRNDLIIASAAWRATSACNWPDLVSVHDLALALQPSAERHLEAVTQGNAFMMAIAASWPNTALDAARETAAGDIAYPVAVGLTSAAHAIDLDGTLVAYAIAFVSNLVSAAIRLSLIGQTDGQRIIAALLSPIHDTARAVAGTTLADLGSATLRSDLASLAHETQYSRLFRS